MKKPERNLLSIRLNVKRTRSIPRKRKYGSYRKGCAVRRARRSSEGVRGSIPLYIAAGERILSKLTPDAYFVKAFSRVGSAHMVNPDFNGITPTMFICANSESVELEVENILRQFGWEYGDMGSAKAARAIEPLAILWCIPGFRQEHWSHVYKLLKK